MGLDLPGKRSGRGTQSHREDWRECVSEPNIYGGDTGFPFVCAHPAITEPAVRVTAHLSARVCTALHPHVSGSKPQAGWRHRPRLQNEPGKSPKGSGL